MRVRIFVLEGASGTGKESSLENLPRTPASSASALKNQNILILIMTEYLMWMVLLGGVEVVQYDLLVSCRYENHQTFLRHDPF